MNKVDNNLICITKHAYLRMKQRNGWSKKTADRMVQRVYDCGLRPEQVKGYLKAWIKAKMNEDINGNDFILYGGGVYVFRENALVTVLHAPTKGYVMEHLF